MRPIGGLLLVIALVAVPGVGLAEHFSVGAEGTVSGPVEYPEAPSVPPELRDRGTRTDCQDAKLDPDDLGQATGDTMCGELVYHEDTKWQVFAPPDQILHPEIGGFDVRRTHNLGTYALTTCRPWCQEPWLTAPVYDRLNHHAWQLGLSHSDWADEADGGRQRYGVSWKVQHALGFANANFDVGEGDGWMLPSTDHTFVAFLEDAGGHAIDASRLRSIVAHTDDLSSLARPVVCGYTPDADLAPDDGSPACELPFRWSGEDGDGGSNPCRSPAYVCGTLTRAWHAQVVCGIATSSCQHDMADPARPEAATNVSRDPTTKTPQQGRAEDSTTDPVVWHFVVAPTPSECDGGREPGFDRNPLADYAYLAHDLDVYTTLDSQREDEQVSPLADGSEGTAIDLASEAARTATRPAWRQPPPEPNHQGTQEGVEDTTGDREIAREWDKCRRLQDPPEHRDAFDPWVNRIDARLERTLPEGDVEGTLELPTGPDGERARTGSYTPEGRIVYGADTDDDGSYATVRWEEQFRAPEQTGIYPILWDMQATETGEVDRSAGCPVHGGLTSVQVTLPAAMQEAGYRARTGLVQAFAFDEPVLWEYRPTGDVFPFPRGGVFLLASQAIHQQGSRGPATDPAVVDHVETVARAAASAADMATSSPIVLNEWTGDLGSPSDYQSQCGEQAGGFTSSWTVTRACSGRGDCADAASVTRVLLDLGDPTRAFENHNAWAKPFPDDHDEAFPSGTHNWTDVDRLGPGG